MFLNGAGIFEQSVGAGNRVEIGYRTVPPGYISWRNRVLGIDSWAPKMFTNSGSEFSDRRPHSPPRPRWHHVVLCHNSCPFFSRVFPQRENFHFSFRNVFDINPSNTCWRYPWLNYGPHWAVIDGFLTDRARDNSCLLVNELCVQYFRLCFCGEFWSYIFYFDLAFNPNPS